jgi:hypothetical protein
MDERTGIEEAEKTEVMIAELSRKLDEAERAFARYISRAPARRTKRHVIVQTNLKTLQSRIAKLLYARNRFFDYAEKYQMEIEGMDSLSALLERSSSLLEEMGTPYRGNPIIKRDVTKSKQNLLRDSAIG